MTAERTIHKPGIVHLGLGAFHRAHQAVYTQRALDLQGGDWGITAVAMRNEQLTQSLNAHNGCYTLIEQHPSGPVAHSMDVIQEALTLSTQADLVINALCAAQTKIVTITVTEKGYCFDATTRTLDLQNPVISHDLSNPEQPTGLIGVLVAALARRQSQGMAGLTILSCDNLSDNGKLLKDLVTQFAEQSHPTLPPWILQHCAFPCSMVDRITPAATEDTLTLAQNLTGHADPNAIETEPFIQWVIEDNFVGDRPAWRQAGVVYAKNIAPFEEMKLRMLNGAHSMIAYLGTVSGFSAVRDVMADSVAATLVEKHMAAAAQTLAPIEGYNFQQYARELCERFRNPTIDHRCAQIAMDGSQKMPQRIFAPAAELLKHGQSVATFSLATALWLRHIESTKALQDPLATQLKAAVQNNPLTQFSNTTAVADFDLFSHNDWVSEVTKHLESLRRCGCKADTLQAIESI